jgi:hypothetical protein
MTLKLQHWKIKGSLWTFDCQPTGLDLELATNNRQTTVVTACFLYIQ